MKLLFLFITFLSSFGATAVELLEGNSDPCKEIVTYFNSHISKDRGLSLNIVPGDTKMIRLGDHSTGKKFNLSASEVSSMRRIWLRYEDIDNDQKKELFADWVSYANTYTDNRSSIYVFSYPSIEHLEDIFAKGKYKSEYYPGLESWFVNNFRWDSYSGPVGANSVLPSSLDLSPGDVWHAGAGFSDPSNDYFLTVFSLKSVQYILVSGRHDKQGKGFVIKSKNAEKQKFDSLCKLDKL